MQKTPEGGTNRGSWDSGSGRLVPSERIRKALGESHALTHARGLTVACGQGAVQVLQVQRAGSRAMSAAEFLRGVPVRAGARFG